MKRTTLLSLILFITWCAQAQDNGWFETGTTWTYFYTFNPPLPSDPNTANVAFSITEQTVINGIACSKMDVAEGVSNPFTHFAVPPPYYFYTSNDSVFYASDYDPTFRFAYDFGAAPGDSWVFEAPIELYDAVGSYAVAVDAIGTTVIDGEELRTLDLSFTDLEDEPWLSLEGIPNGMTVTERLGAPHFFFVPFGIPGPGGGAAVSGPWDITLQCYSSGSINYVNPDFGSCVLSANDAEPAAGLHLFPNPAAHEVRITLPGNPTGMDRLEMYDMKGRLIHHSQLTPSADGGHVVDVSALQPGLYVVRLHRRGEAYSHKMLVAGSAR